jgi:hypothetical protein
LTFLENLFMYLIKQKLKMKYTKSLFFIQLTAILSFYCFVFFGFSFLVQNVSMLLNLEENKWYRNLVFWLLTFFIVNT